MECVHSPLTGGLFHCVIYTFIMNIKSIIVAGFIAVTALSVGDSAMAKTTKCWYGDAGTHLTHYFCDVNRRVNANGHIVFVVNGLGTVVMWDDDTAEIIGDDGGYTDNLIVETTGRDHRLVNLDNDYNFIFRY